MRNILCILFGLSLVLLSSCLTVYEKYFLNHDGGSGSMEYLIDMCDMRSALASVSDSSVTVTANFFQIIMNSEILKTKIKTK